MTPVIFVSFLFSLAWIELRYSMLRSHHHDSRPPPGYKSGSSSSSSSNSNSNSSGGPSDSNNTTGNKDEQSPACSHHRMPDWLHSIVYRRQPYHYVLVKGDAQHAGAGGKTTTAASTRTAGDDKYYHTMQRKLLKMETDEAFRIRTTVLCVMGAVAVGSAWASLVFMRWIASCFW